GGQGRAGGGGGRRPDGGAPRRRGCADLDPATRAAGLTHAFRLRPAAANPCSILGIQTLDTEYDTENTLMLAQLVGLTGRHGRGHGEGAARDAGTVEGG